VTAVVPWISLLISALSVFFTWASKNVRDRRKAERDVHVGRVSIEVVERRDEVTDHSRMHFGAVCACQGLPDHRRYRATAAGSPNAPVLRQHAHSWS
jgi:hypothetical protein